MPERIAADERIDITAEICPMTFVRTRLALDRLGPGQVLEVRLRGEEPARNVPATARRLGHAVLVEETNAEGVTLLLLRKAASAASR